MSVARLPGVSRWLWSHFRHTEPMDLVLRRTHMGSAPAYRALRSGGHNVNYVAVGRRSRPGARGCHRHVAQQASSATSPDLLRAGRHAGVNRRSTHRGYSRLAWHPDDQELHLRKIEFRAPDAWWRLTGTEGAEISYGGRGVRIRDLLLVSDAGGRIARSIRCATVATDGLAKSGHLPHPCVRPVVPAVRECRVAAPLASVLGHEPACILDRVSVAAGGRGAAARSTCTRSGCQLFDRKAQRDRRCSRCQARARAGCDPRIAQRHPANHAAR